jgi:arylsulfatase A-like enzyme
MVFDVFSTVLDAVGLPIPERNGDYPVHGVSLLPHLRSAGNSPLPDRYLFWDLYGDCGASHGPWKLVGQISNHHGNFARAADEAEKTQFALYNLDEDLREAKDLSAQFRRSTGNLRHDIRNGFAALQHRMVRDRRP